MKTSRWLILAASSIALLLCLLAVTATGQAGSRIVPEGQTLGVPSDDQGDSVILPEGVSSDWWTQVQKDIQQSEYNVTWQEQTCLPDLAAAYQAPNRAHNLRTYFTPAGIRIIPREDAPQWELGLTLTGFGYAGATEPVAEPELSADGHRMSYGRGNVSEWYINTEDGLEQGFTIAVRPGDVADGQTELVLEMSLSGDLVPALTEEGQAVEFATPDGLAPLRYSGLLVTDASGKMLPSRLSVSGSGLSIAVDDSSAVYPIEIDPMLTTPHYNFFINSSGAKLGSSVSTAGDVNGDGYSDVIVGAPFYDGGSPAQGLVTVRYGSSTGLAGGTSWLALSGQANARFGDSVDTAGDVNGDGYSDIIAGAPWYDNPDTDEGMAFVWYGSATGLGETNGSPTNADWKVEGDQAGALMGDCVATAGDVNGDGYSDVIIGVRLYDSGDTDEGMAVVYHGSASGLSVTSNWSDQSDRAYAYQGYSVRTAGDVNGDGYSDVLISACYWDHDQTDEGRVLVYHGSETGLGGSYDWSAEGDQASAYFGISVSTAGDVNGDGYSDVIIGAHYYDDPDMTEGAAFVWYGSSNGLNNDVDGTPANADWTAESNQASAYFGASVSTAGDVNGDGYADIIVGAPNYDDGIVDEGGAFIWYGSLSGLGSSGVPANADWVATGGQASAYFGTAVNIAGDVNGDGYSDVVVGAPAYDYNAYTDAGRGCVYLGAAGDPGSTPWTAESNQAGAYFGTSVSTAGDVNGDGYTDVIIGASWYNGGQSSEGRVYVYYGSATGLNTSPAWTAESDQGGANLGISVGTAGDVNGDGYSDVIVGADYYANSQTDEGAAFVWYGSASGLGASGTPTNADWTAESDQESARLGLCVGTAGDVNGDGYSDVIVGADRYVLPDNDWGATFVWLGSSSGLGVNGTPANADWTAVSDQGTPVFGGSVGTAGDVNGDGYSDVIIGAQDYHCLAQSDGAVFVYYGSSAGLGENGTTANADWKAGGDQDFAFFGASAGSAGDVNGDGYSDIIVGAPGYTNGQTNEGMAFVYCGSGSGLVSTGVDPADPADADWSAESDAGNAQFGSSVSTAGDVNGDGYSDVIVGAYQYSSGETPEGTAFLWYGSSTGLGSAGTPSNADWSTADDSFFFGSGCSVGMAGDVNGDAYSDVVVGAQGYTNGQSSEGGAFVYYGNGGPGVSVRPRQLRSNFSTPIAQLGKSDRKNVLFMAVTLRNPFGRGYVNTYWECKPFGTPFDGSASAYAWHLPGGTPWFTRSALSPNTQYHWRVRLRYHTPSTPFQQYGRWITIPWNGWQEADLRTAPNTPPVAVDDAGWVTFEDGTATFDAPGVLENVSDADGDSLTAHLVTTVSHGSLTLYTDGSFTYTSTANYNGTDSFTYRAFDGTDYSNTATITIGVQALDDPPSFTKGPNQSVLEDAGAQTVGNWATSISAGPPDESGQLLDFIVSNDNNGLFSVQPAISASGTLTYTPATNAHGSATVTVRLHDNGYVIPPDWDTSEPQTYTITVAAVNDAPSFTKGTNQTVLEDAGAQTVSNWATGLSAGPSDESGQVLDFIVTNSNNALFSVQPAIAANGTLTYTPAANANGSATVTVSIHDNGGTANGGVDTSAPQTFTISVTAVNDLPTAVDDAYGVHRDRTLNVSTPGVLTNDADVEGLLTAALVSDVSHGTLVLNPNGSFTYTPATDYSGPDSFTYKVYDGIDYSNTATVGITVHAVNHAPEAVGDTYTVAEDAALSVPVGTGVLSNDTDADSDPLKTLLVANVSHGVLVLNDDGSFTYTPAANFNGTDSFTYKVNDGLADSGVATVTITVIPVNDLPAATADAYNAFVGITLTVPAPGLLANDSDIDGDLLTAVLVGNVSHGTLALNADGSFTYTVESGFTGTDSFTYNADDGTGDSATVTVTIEVAVPKPPTITSIEAPSGRRGKVITVTITGTNLEGATELDFGAGITVNPSFTSSPTQITAEITIDADAVPGTRDVLVKTPEGTYTLEDAFTVKKASSGGVPVWVWPVVALAVIAAGAGGFFLLRRRPKAG